MSPRENRQVRLTARPSGIPQAEHFSLVTEPVAGPGNGEILIENRYLSVDPAQRGWANDEGNYSATVPLNTPMRALAVGKIVESNVPAFRAGEFVYGWFGWQRYCVAAPDAVLRRVVPSALPLSANLSVLGMNGLTAYLAFHGLGDPKPGEHVLVSTAAGSVGSFVGQLARIAGCRAVGLTSSADKITQAKARYGYQDMINYREAADLGAALRAACPEGNDIFFDNTGGAIADAAIRTMRLRGRIIQCGTAANASWTPVPSGPRPEREVLTRRLRWSGFIIFDHLAEFDAAAKRLADLALAGQIVHDEEVLPGLEHAPGAIARLYRGENHGKLIIAVD
ncbi:NADP-dependent oxidoreductase [Bradyrhizobium zhanjiangense]|uniref:NADP-dependent oxidoreductase n=1 Tax=Bradyrhizobium zhanjiangense TaxID=1325107 RepID=A0A4Q0QTC6_9BRAD|nr:NADP-dependent oxidoreductase [Bradyrhizobium zhanjiangense]RXG99410.1 NADP-dependent oxidoreductase [Bradyrhizobium zhanjiangense]